MNYLSVENLSKFYGERILFQGLHFGLSKGDKMALIANNGTGKSSLLKIITGEDIADEGTVTLRDGIRVKFLNQSPDFDPHLSINELLEGSHSETMKIIRVYEEAVEAQSINYSDETQKAFELASAAMDEVNAWDYDRRLKQLLTLFNIIDLNQKIEKLSGGQIKRLALSMVLLDAPDLLVLDEPTNHLDVEMIEWLEKYLSQNNITLLMVTHDRYFLDRVCNHILELNNGKLYHHKGNYAYFLEKRFQREEVYKTEIAKAGKLMKKELEWMRRTPQARTTKSKSRINAFYETKEKASQKVKKDEIKLEVKMSRIGGKILELKKVYKSYGDLKIMQGFDYTFKKGERIGVVGKNGVGKSTFLNIITEKEKPDSGKINVGDTIVYGYYSQAGIKLKEDKRVIEVLKDIAEVIVTSDGRKLSASQFLEYFMFTPEIQYTYVSKLSGGERRRLHLLTVLIKNPNFLILDEPTNDLDLLTLNKLEEFLMSFGGCLILVSHDRYFMDKLVDHLFVFEGDGKISVFTGNYSQYRGKQKQVEKEASKKEEKPKEFNKNSLGKRKLSFKEKYELENLDREIQELEERKKELEFFIQSGETDYQLLEGKTKELGDVITSIDTKTERWMKLIDLES